MKKIIFAIALIFASAACTINSSLDQAANADSASAQTE